MGATAMNAATIALVLCLAVSIVGEHCDKKPKPRYNCAQGPTGFLFPHPEDCTVLIVCVGTVDVAVTICDDHHYLDAYDPGHAIGCRKQCPNTEWVTEESTTEPCNETADTDPPFTEELSTEPSTNTPAYIETTTTEYTSMKPVQNESTSTEPSNLVNLSTAIWNDKNTVSTPSTGGPIHADCIGVGVFKHPTDCTKAYFCPSAGAHPVEVDVCAESRKDPNFVQGCLGDCKF